MQNNNSIYEDIDPPIRMDTKLKAAKLGIGDRALSVFSQLGWETVGDVRQDPGMPERRIKDAIEILKRNEPHFPEKHWLGLFRRCVNIYIRIQSKEASPEVPVRFMCPISLDWMSTPVVAPSGHSFDQDNINEYLAIDARNPLTREPLNANQLYRNLNLEEAIRIHRLHHITNAILT